MQRALDQLTIEISVLLLVASGLLIGASLVGVGGQRWFVAVLAVLAAALLAARDRLPSPGEVSGLDLERYLRHLWVSPALGAVAVVIVLGATPEEIQSVGGVLGLLGMLNYFLRPVYNLVYSLAHRVVGIERAES